MRSARALPRAIVDTNLIVSGIILKRGNPFDLLEAWRGRQFMLLMGQVQRNEIENVLTRPKIYQKYRISPTEIAVILQGLDLDTLRVIPSVLPPISIRDKKDEAILATALGGYAEYLVTGDDDLLVLRDEPQLEGLKILTAREFLRLLRSETAGEGHDV